jgi:hypothetical protein
MMNSKSKGKDQKVKVKEESATLLPFAFRLLLSSGGC